jgi:chromosomal replication initiation ATPase DnaA
MPFSPVLLKFRLFMHTAKVTGVSLDKLNSRDRAYDAIHARWVMMAMLRDNKYNLSAIGRLVERDHSTVIHGLRKAQQLRKLDPQFDLWCAEITSRLEADNEETDRLDRRYGQLTG